MFVTPGSRAGRGSASINVLYPQSSSSMVNIPYSSSISLDFGNGRRNNFILGSLTGNLTLANPVNMRVGQQVYIEIPQDGTGSRTVSFGSFWKFAGGAPTASTTASSIDAVVGEVVASGTIRASYLKAFA